jgi:hypothetical protein
MPELCLRGTVRNGDEKGFDTRTRIGCALPDAA